MSYYEPATYSRPVTTSSAEAQKWFDRGLRQIYGCQYHEAISCFQNAVAADPCCAMAHWGTAYAIYPTYAKSPETSAEHRKPAYLTLAANSLAAAKPLKPSLQPAERALLSAAAKRAPDCSSATVAASAQVAYASAMRQAHAAHPDDLDVCALFAESLMSESSWLLWDLSTGFSAGGAGMPEEIQVLERAFRELPGAWTHPGLQRLYMCS